MKTLIISLEYPPRIGGIASYIYNFLKHVRSEDYVVYAPKTNGDREYDKSNPWKVYRERPYNFFWPHWAKMVFQIARIVRFEKIDKIHIHHVLPVGYVGLILKRALRIPYVIFLHGSDVMLATSTPWKKKMFSMILRNADKIVVNSRFLQKRVLSHVEGLQNIHILYPCPNEFFLKRVADDKLETLKHRLNLKGKKVALTVSRMVDGKGFPHIVRVLSEVNRDFPDLVWLLVGDGPKKKTVVNLIKKYHLQNSVRLLGAIPHDELPPYYQIANVFVLLCHPDDNAEESWGSVFLEASASGLPVIAGRVGGVEEAISHLETGLLVDVYQTKQVSSAISEILSNQNFAHELGRAGKDRVGREFLWEKQIGRL